jgi:integrase
VTLDAATVAAIEAHRSRQLAERDLAGSAYIDRDLIFATELGGPLSPQRITATFNRIRKAAGVRPGRLHDLRHSHASHLLSCGVSVPTVSVRLGHPSAVVTLSVYAHVIPSSDKAAVEAFAEALR